MPDQFRMTNGRLGRVALKIADAVVALVTNHSAKRRAAVTRSGSDDVKSLLRDFGDVDRSVIVMLLDNGEVAGLLEIAKGQHRFFIEVILRVLLIPPHLLRHLGVHRFALEEKRAENLLRSLRGKRLGALTREQQQDRRKCNSLTRPTAHVIPRCFDRKNPQPSRRTLP